ncbi:MAG: hypothetical protein ACR2OH_02585 [Microthrixaceae bacterium]
MISILVLAGLAVVWAIVIFPDVVRWISNNRRGDTIRTFNSQLSSLGRSNALRNDNVIELRDRMVSPSSTGSALRAPSRDVIPIGSQQHERVASDQRPQQPQPRPVAQSEVAGPSPKPVSPAVRKRRQDVLVALGAACLLTLLATIAFGPVFLYVHLLADALLVGYLLLLQRAISGKAAPRSATSHSTAPIGSLAPTGTAGVRSSIVEPRRIAN